MRNIILKTGIKMKSRYILSILAVLVIFFCQSCVKRISEKEVIRRLTGATPVAAVKNSGEYVEMAELSLDRDNIDEALDYCKKALELDPKSGEAHYVIGMANIKAGNFDIAKTSFEKALKLDPKLSMAHAYLGYVNYSLGYFDESIKQYDLVIKKANRYPLFLNHRGLAYLMTGDMKRAEKDFNDAIESEPEEPSSYDNKALLLMLKGRYDEAENELKKIKKDQWDLTQRIESEGILLYLRNDKDRARTELKEALSQDGSLLLARFFLALIEKESGNEAESLKIAAEALSKDGKYGGEGRMVLKALNEKYPNTDLGKAAGRILKLTADAGPGK